MLNNIIKNLTIVVLLMFFINVPFSRASFDDFSKRLEDFLSEGSENTSIILNSIQTSSNSGGSVAEAGAFVNGTSSTSLKVKTIINGELIEDLEINKISNKEDQGIEYKSNIEVSENKVRLETVKEINGETEKSSKEFLIDDNFENEINSFNKINSNLTDNSPGSEEIFDNRETLNGDDIGDAVVKEPLKQSEQINIETPLVLKIINIILDIFKNNMDRISKLF